METVKNNLRAFLIHILGSILFLILLFTYVAASPLYQMELISKIVMVLLYVFIISLYLTTLKNFLQTQTNPKFEYLSGILVATVGLVIWLLTYVNQAKYSAIFHENEQWIPYNIYNYLLWPIMYGLKNPNTLLGFGLLNGAFAPIALIYKRKTIKQFT